MFELNKWYNNIILTKIEMQWRQKEEKKIQKIYVTAFCLSSKDFSLVFSYFTSKQLLKVRYEAFNTTHSRSALRRYGNPYE